MYGWPQVCVHILMLGGKKAGGSLRNRRAKTREQLRCEKCAFCVFTKRQTRHPSSVCMRRWSRLLAEKSTSGIFYAFPIRQLYVCTCVCVFWCFYLFIVFLFRCLCRCRYEWPNTCTHPYVLANIHIYNRVCVCVCLFIWLYVWAFVCLLLFSLILFWFRFACLCMQARSIDGEPCGACHCESSQSVSLCVYVCGAKQAEKWTVLPTSVYHLKKKVALFDVSPFPLGPTRSWSFPKRFRLPWK